MKFSTLSVFSDIIFITTICSLCTPPITSRATTALTVSNVRHATLVAIFVNQTELPVSLDVVKPALQLGIMEANRRYPNLKFDLVIREDSRSCMNNYAPVFAAEEYLLRKVNAFIGPVCTYALDPVARMASYWNIPLLTVGGVGVPFSKKNIYTSLTRLAFALGKQFNTYKVKFN